MPWIRRWLALLLLLDPAFCNYSGGSVQLEGKWPVPGSWQRGTDLLALRRRVPGMAVSRRSFAPKPVSPPDHGPRGQRETAARHGLHQVLQQLPGAQIYLERDGVLELLLSETEAALQPKVRCFRWLSGDKVALFLQSTPHQDISRRIAAFRYELRGEWNAHFSWPWRNLSVKDAGTCRPCNNTEILMAVCTSDFVIRGNIKSVSNNREAQESVIGVSATRIHRQKFALFQPVGKSGKSTGNIRTLLRCGVKPGPGSFLFTGWMHFAEAWLTCAPRYKDFIRIYEEAQQAHENPCEVSLD